LRTAHLTVAFLTVAGVIFCALQLVSSGTTVAESAWQTRRLLLLVVVLGYLAAVAAAHYRIAKVGTDRSVRLSGSDCALPISGLAVAATAAAVMFVGAGSNLLMIGLWSMIATLVTVGALSAGVLLMDWFLGRSRKAAPKTELFPASWRSKHAMLSLIVVAAIILMESVG